MQEQNSGRFQIDWRNIVQVSGAIVIGALSIYASNTEFFNTLLSLYISPESFTVVTMILAYLVKKFLTNYSK